MQFLLKKDGRGGYDTPKFAAALIQLARRDYQRQEMLIRVDEDVQPTAAGIKELKTAYYQLTHDPANKHFCISWNYENTPPGVGARPSDESYEGLFSKFVNSYSIRTTFLAEPAVRGHFEPETGRLFCDSPEE